jgi:inositol oxygenase
MRTLFALTCLATAAVASVDVILDAATAGMLPVTDLVSGKPLTEFRNYDENPMVSTVRQHYRMMRANQTLAFVQRMEAKYNKFDKGQMTLWEAFEKLQGYVDTSDPDTSLPNVQHALQTAEAARAAGRDEWFVFTCWIHDFGKIMFLWGSAADGQEGSLTGPQWALGGDTWVVGARIPDSVVMPELNALNQDMQDPVYSTENGIYQPHVGMHNLHYTWGHDEYIYQLVKHNKCALPPQALAILRFHSLYTWHKGGAYSQFMAPGDEALIKSVKDFNQFDLYTKASDPVNTDEVRAYYTDLALKFCPAVLNW